MASDCGGQRSLHFSPSGHSVVWGGRRSPSGFGDAHGEDCLFADALRRCGARPVLRDMRAAPAGRRRGLEAHPPQLALHRRFGGVRRASFFRACAVQGHGMCLFRADRACCFSDGGSSRAPCPSLPYIVFSLCRRETRSDYPTSAPLPACAPAGARLSAPHERAPANRPHMCHGPRIDVFGAHRAGAALHLVQVPFWLFPTLAHNPARREVQ